MKNFMIGQFDKFDIIRQNSEFREDFYGIEVNQMSTERDLELLKKYVNDSQINVGIHFPLIKNSWRHRDPQYMSKSKTVKMESYAYMEDQILKASELSPSYILLHYPKPVILDEHVDWSSWRFSDVSEYYSRKEFTIEEFKTKSEEFFMWFSSMGRLHNFTPILELDSITRYIYDTDLVETLLEKYENIRICLDIGRLHLQDSIDECFDPKKVIKKFGKYTSLVHLWNCTVRTNKGSERHPATRNLKPEDGWANIEGYLSELGKYSRDYKIMFEHNSSLISKCELEECYKWIQVISKK